MKRNDREEQQELQQQQQRQQQHQPVMVSEVLTGLDIQKEGIYLDATFGRGGHARAILDNLGEQGQLYAMDRDPEVLPLAENLAKNDPRFHFHLAPFSTLLQFCETQELIGNVNGILLDLGVSSPQLDSAERGFSFRLSGPLDMRMDPNTGVSAREWLNTAALEDIDFVLKEYGEERFHRRIASAIVHAREISPLKTTEELAEIIAKAHPKWEKYKHPATRSFQAIRIYVNDEIGELIRVLEQALTVLTEGGRLVVISFHSLEDRIVKQFIQKGEQGNKNSIHTKLPIEERDRKQTIKRIGGMQTPTEEELRINIRARSARLRVFEKLHINKEKSKNKSMGKDENKNRDRG